MKIDRIGTHTISYFDTLHEFYNYMKQNESKILNSDCTYVSGKYLEVKKYMSEVNEDLLREYKKQQDLNINKINYLKDRILIKYKNDIVGSLPNVPNAVMNLPQSMISIQRHRVKTNTKIINIVIDCGIDYRWEQHEIVHRLMALLKMVDELELSGYRINLYAGCWCYGVKKRSHVITKQQTTIIKLKSCNEPLDVAKLMFVLCDRRFVKNMLIAYLLTQDYINAYIFDRTSTEKIKRTLKNMVNVDAFGISFEYDTENIEYIKRKVCEYNEIERKI